MAATTIPAFPLQWPTGWDRTIRIFRVTARFGKARRQTYTGSWESSRSLTIAEAVDRVRAELQRMGLHDDDIVISTNLELRLDGLPRSGQREPEDPGAAVYWRDKGATRCMAIDRYDRVADNLAAIAATLEAMRSIERHGGAEILDRAFTGFSALPAPESSRPWHIVLGCPAHASTDQVRECYRRARGAFHPDRGGDAATFDDIQRAWESFCTERGVN